MTTTKTKTTGFFKKCTSVFLALIMMMSIFSGLNLTAYAQDNLLYNYSGTFNSWNEYKSLSIPVELPRDYCKQFKIVYECENYDLKLSIMTSNGNNEYSAYYDGPVTLTTDSWQSEYSFLIEPVTSVNDRNDFKKSSWTVKIYDVTPITSVKSIKRTGTAVYFEWADAGKDVTGYRIMGSVNSDGSNADFFFTGGTHFTVKGVEKKYNYYFQITPFKDFSDGSRNYFPSTKVYVSKSTVVSISKCKISGIKTKTYTGKALTQSITVKYGNVTLKNGTDYTVSYKNNKNVGTATVTITGKGKYSGTIKKTFTIIPKSTSISKLTAKKKGFTVKWNKQSTQTTGYQLQYSTSSAFKNAKTLTVSNNKTVSKSVSKLSAKKKYYVRIRTYKTVNGKKLYSSWSKSKTVKTK